MIQNIFVGIMAVLAIGVGIWAMWLENGSTQEDSKTEAETPKKKKDKEK
jgi:cadmium resistance protein CadD (predicted permease)